MLPPEGAQAGGGDCVSSKTLVLATAVDETGSTSTVMQGRNPLGEITETGLVLYDPLALSYEVFEQMGRLFGKANRQLQWVIGDWLIMVEEIYPDRYSQAVEATGLSPQTLMNRRSVCGKIPGGKGPGNRRRAGVPFSVHAELAYLEPKDRDRWLARAEKEDMTREILREHLGRTPPQKAIAQDSGPVDNAVVTSSAANHGELVPGPMHTCPNCGTEFS